MFTRRDLARLAALGAAASLPAPVRAQAQGNVTVYPLTSQYVPGELGVAIYRPPGYDRQRAEAFPLLLLLHGGNGSERDLLYFKAVFDAEILAGRLPPLVIATPSARRSLYMDYKDGSQRWESFILADVLPLLRRSEHVAQDRERTFLCGVSMGGLGALRIAFKHPQLFAAVTALEPAIEATLTWQGVGPETRSWRPETVLHPMFGDPIDPDYWEANNPATIANRDPGRLLDLRIYLEVGDQDMLSLYEGVEFLHRVLFDARLAHEYRLVHGADHVGRSLLPRMADALGFIGRQLSPPDWIDPSVLDLRAAMDRSRRASGLEVEAFDPRRLRGGRAVPRGHEPE
jgi:S-formylglutathione hydrolase